MAVIGGGNIGTLGKQCIRLVKKQDGVGITGCVKKGGEVFFGFTNILA